MKLCSACLLGVKCCFNGKNNRNKKILELAKKETLIPVCPEQLGGLPTPRPAAEIKDNKIINQNGQDVTENYARGTEEVLKIAKLLNIKEAILKQRSPSCGSGQIRNLFGEIIKGNGATTALLKRNGIKVISEEDL